MPDTDPEVSFPVLDPVTIRVLGTLMEKQQTTPEYYPMTLNALVAACNQRTSREPITDYTSDDVEAALHRLQDHQLVWQIHGGRSVRWEHNLTKRFDLAPDAHALLTLMFLRTEQTSAELRSRAERLYPFKEIREVEETLLTLSRRTPPLVTELPRRPGQKESRWRQTVSLPDERPPETPPQQSAAGTVAARVSSLETRVEELALELQRLKERLGES